MLAAIDVGSNTVRMLIADVAEEDIKPVLYRQKITRLVGGFTSAKDFSKDSIDLTFSTLLSFIDELNQYQVEKIRLVGTAACRLATNSNLLANKLKLATGLELEIIPGEEEARLSAKGVLSALSPLPSTSLLIDIGGGSTEIVICKQKKLIYSNSYPIGVVRLCEDMPDPTVRQSYIKDMVVKFCSDMLHAHVSPDLLSSCEIVGTAGTMTTLAAMKLQMSEYDPQRVNNILIELNLLQSLKHQLAGMSVSEREEMPGLEEGRGDIIVPGLEIIIAICNYLKKPSVRVIDAGLLEGILLDFHQS